MSENFDELWNRYIGAHVTPAEYGAHGWDMARILDDLRADDLTGPELMEVANAIAAGLEELDYPITQKVDTLTLTTAHAASSYGVPVLLIDGEPYGPADLTPAGVTAAALVTTWSARYAGKADLRAALLREALEFIGGVTWPDATSAHTALRLAERLTAALGRDAIGGAS